MGMMLKLSAGAALIVAFGCAKPHLSPMGTTKPGGILLNIAQMDGTVRELMKRAKVPGLAMAIIQDGVVVRATTFGMADQEKQRPLKPDTIMYGASLTKAAFAYMTMQLVDEGVVDLDAPVTRLLKRPLPEYNEFADLAQDERWRRITPRMLLSHSSGLLNWRWINDDEKLDIKFEPGTRYVYSGEGIQLLQLIVEERTGQSVQALMQARVFDRFHMKRTSMIWRDDFTDSTSIGYGIDGAALPHKQRKTPRAAGSMDTTLADYASFVAGFLRGEGLSDSSRREMQRAQTRIVSPQQFPSHFPGETSVNDGIKLSCGLGWVVYESPLGPALFKEGNDDGTNNFVLAFPKSKTAVVLLSNSSRADQIYFPLVEALFGPTCLPWFWMGYIPFDRPELRAPGARAHPVAPCGETVTSAAR